MLDSLKKQKQRLNHSLRSQGLEALLWIEMNYYDPASQNVIFLLDIL